MRLLFTAILLIAIVLPLSAKPPEPINIEEYYRNLPEHRIPTVPLKNHIIRYKHKHRASAEARRYLEEAKRSRKESKQHLREASKQLRQAMIDSKKPDYLWRIFCATSAIMLIGIPTLLSIDIFFKRLKT